jgi:hypothetical protein
MSAPAQQTPMNNTQQQQSATSSNQHQSTSEVLPNPNTLLQASKISIEQDRPILLDYYRQTATGTAFLGEDKETKERILVKSKEEYTSLIKKLYKVADDFIILTENSLYIVSGKIQKRGINLASLHDGSD